MSRETPDRPSISPSPDGPYIVNGLNNLQDKNGPVETTERMALCRCGGSKNKPFCDGTHGKIGFHSGKEEGRVADKRDNYPGKQITLHDNRGICAHAGFCTDGLPAVFKLGQEPWIDPDAAGAEQVIAQVKQCPSGALSHSREGTEHRDQERMPAIMIAPNGPYVVTGGPELVEADRAEGASTEHFTLCRCGGSKNKPFCDGTHWYRKFDEHAE